MRRVFLFSVLGAVLMLAVAQAGATPVNYQDRVGDSGNAPDLTSVVIDNDGGGTITIQVSIANAGDLNPDSYIALDLDTDRNSSTGGSNYYGSEYSLVLRGMDRTYTFYRWNGSAFEYAPSPTLQVATVGLQTFRVTINRSDLGNTPGFNFHLIGTQYGGSVLLARDDAPDGNQSWTYALCCISAPPPTSTTSSPQPSPTVRLGQLSARPTSGVFQGRIFTVWARVVTNVPAVRVRCSANVSGRRVPMVGRYSAGVASCQGIPPVGTAGRRLTGAITVTIGGDSDSRLFSFLVRR